MNWSEDDRIDNPSRELQNVHGVENKNHTPLLTLGVNVDENKKSWPLGLLRFIGTGNRTSLLICDSE